MSTRVVERVDDWDEQSFTDGYRQLNDLADTEFSGVVRAGGAELYMTKGVVVGIRQGDIDDFEDASGTVYRAPSPALPVLAIMQERAEGVRDKFYSEKTAIEEVDRTLSDAGFTGYIELSENVLSGDYYLVYHGGESMSVAYVGNAKRLIDGNEAFETANDEVGIYKVRQVDLDPIEIPSPAEPESAGGAGGTDSVSSAGTGGGSSSGGGSGGDSGSGGGDDSSDSASNDTETDAGAATSQAGAGTRSDGVDGSAGTTAAGAGERSDGDQGGQVSAEGADGAAGGASGKNTAASGETDAGRNAESGPAAGQDGAQTDAGRGESAQRQSESADQRGRPGGRGGSTGSAGTQTQRRDTGRESRASEGRRGGSTANRGKPVPEGSLDLETRAIPSLDPARTRTLEQETPTTPEPERSAREAAGGAAPAQQPPARDQSTGPAQADANQQPAQGQEGAGAERVEELESELEEREAEVERLQDQVETAESERAELEQELESVRSERDELATELEKHEQELERLETELGAATNAEQRMTPGEALRGTDIFIRYHSKGQATLEKAHGSSIRRDEVNENLRLEKHTQFDDATVAVGGQSYAEFLEATVEYQFVEWVVRELLFEIRETGHAKQLKNLYDVLPEVDRAELAGVVEVTFTEDGQEQRRQESFDVVLRNRMGNPLLVANLNDSREAATEAMMEDIITAAERVGQGAESFAGAFMVTTSFFEPGALEMAADATQGGILSRDKRKSFVNLSRKRGYHLCLVEARNENFHLAVPEL